MVRLAQKREPFAHQHPIQRGLRTFTEWLLR